MASTESLSALSQYYSTRLEPTDLSDLRGLAEAHAIACASSLIECASIGFAFDAIFANIPTHWRRVGSAMRNAWNQAIPDRPLETPEEVSLNLIAQHIPDWRGRLFDFEVVSRLNSGRWVGTLCLERGQRAAISPATDTSPTVLQITTPAATTYQARAIELIQSYRDALKRSADDPLFVLEMINAKHAPAPNTNSNNEAIALTMPPLPNTDCSEDSERRCFGINPEALADLAIHFTENLLAENRNDLGNPASRDIKLVATPRFFATFSPLFTHNSNDLPASRRTTPDFLPLPVNLARLKMSCSRLTEQVCALESLYPCPERNPKPRPATYINEYDELLLIVDSVTRLVIQKGEMPLDQWILSMVNRDATTMTESVLQHHLEDLLAIKENNLVNQAFCGPGFLSRWENAMTGGRLLLAERLDDAIEIADCVRNAARARSPTLTIKGILQLEAIADERSFNQKWGMLNRPPQKL